MSTERVYEQERKELLKVYDDATCRYYEELVRSTDMYFVPEYVCNNVIVREDGSDGKSK